MLTRWTRPYSPSLPYFEESKKQIMNRSCSPTKTRATTTSKKKSIFSTLPERMWPTTTYDSWTSVPDRGAFYLPVLKTIIFWHQTSNTNRGDAPAAVVVYPVELGPKLLRANNMFFSSTPRTTTSSIAYFYSQFALFPHRALVAGVLG